MTNAGPPDGRAMLVIPQAAAVAQDAVGFAAGWPNLTGLAPGVSMSIGIPGRQERIVHTFFTTTLGVLRPDTRVRRRGRDRR